MKQLLAVAWLISLTGVNCRHLDHSNHQIDHRDFSDYSGHYTRTDVANRNSAAAPPASGPYFAFELKEMAQQWNSLDYYDYFALPQTAVDYSGNAFHPQQFYPPMTYKRPSMIGPHKRRKPQRNKPLKTTEVEKISEEAENSLAPSASPNGVMGVVSLVAGIVWFLVNRSATPVVKMRSDSDARDASDELDFQRLTASWSLASLQDAQCRRRAVCDLVNQRPSFFPYAQIIQSILQKKLVEDVVTSTISKETYQSLADLLTSAVISDDCNQIFPNCSNPLPIEPRDRR